MIAKAGSLHVEVVGEGPAILFAHGFSGSARNWGPQVRAFRDGHRVVTYDLRGHARSDVPEPGSKAYGLDAFGDDVGEALDAAEVDRAVLVGLSLGAAVCLAFARAQPERVRGLVLASPPAPGDRAGGFSGRADEMARMLEEQGSEATGARFVWGPESGLDERGAALVRQGFLEHDPRGLAGILRGVLVGVGEAMESAAAGLDPKLPVQTIAGGRDAGSIESIERLRGRRPEWAASTIEGAGHVVNLAAPAAFNREVEAFLARLPEESANPRRG